MIEMTFTEAACAYIKKMVAKEQGVGFRLTIKKTGCSGFAYAPSVITTINEKDFVLQKEGLSIYIDPLWMHLLEKICVDYIEDDKLGLKQKRLVFINPNEGNRCGCGESFQIEK